MTLKKNNNISLHKSLFIAFFESTNLKEHSSQIPNEYVQQNCKHWNSAVNIGLIVLSTILLDSLKYD